MKTAFVVLVALVASLIGAAAALVAGAISAQRDQHRLPDLESALGIRAWDVQAPPHVQLGVRLVSSDGVVASSGMIGIDSQDKLRLVMHSDLRERGLKHICIYNRTSQGWCSIRVPDTYQIAQPGRSDPLVPGNVLVMYGEKTASSLDKPGPGELALTLHAE